MSIEPFQGWRRRVKATWSEIQEIKRNIKKVPIIQAKTDKYTKQERESADKEFIYKITSFGQLNTKVNNMPSGSDTIWWRKRLQKWIINTIISRF